MRYVDQINTEDLIPSPYIGLSYGGRIILACFRKNNTLYYIVECLNCKNNKYLDTNLFISDYQFIFRLLNKKLEHLPCACSKSYKYWSKDQYLERCKDTIEGNNYTIIGVQNEEHVNTKSSIKIICNKHNESFTTTINNVLKVKKITGCSVCKLEALRSANLYADDVMIKSFRDTGRHVKETIFKRLLPEDEYFKQHPTKRLSRYWRVTCGVCGENYISTCDNLQKGKLGCACSKEHKFLYIFKLIDQSKNIVAYKYGVTNNVSVRLSQQQKKSTLDVLLYKVFSFETTGDCNQAESLCREIDKSYLSKEVYMDGYTETFRPSMLDSIEAILYARSKDITEQYK